MQEEFIKKYVTHVPSEKLVLGVPAYNVPIFLYDEDATRLNSKINLYNNKQRNSELVFKDFISVSNKRNIWINKYTKIFDYIVFLFLFNLIYDMHVLLRLLAAF
jgi:spore germination protein YaaH